jgi:hypothetical protein
VKKVILVVAALTALVASQLATASVRAPTRHAGGTGSSRKQPVTLGFYRGETVRYYDFGPIKLQPGNKLAPIWTFTNGAPGQRNIIDTVPGQKAYTPLWQVNQVTWAAGKSPQVLRSADEVRKAAADGELSIAQTATVVNCPVLGFGQTKVAGYSAGHLIHYYDLGPVRVAPGNAVLPLYTITNGVKGQHNVTRDTIAPGQTAYPPLWGIVKVSWKPGAKPRLLKSFAQIKRARASGQVTLQTTSLVVNCPLV